MRKFIYCFVVLVGLLAGVRAAWAQSPTTSSELWIDFSLGPPLVDVFNASARADDIARVENISQFRMLENVVAGRKLVVFRSVDEAARFLPQIADQIDIVGYNLENGLPNPAEEQADPVASVQRMRQLANEYDLDLMMGPDRQFAMEYGAQMAPFVDTMVLQVQRVQTEPQTVSSYIVPMSQLLRAANPNIEISMQVRTEGDIAELVSLIELLQESLDGVSILTSLETTETASELMTALRPPQSNGLTETDLAELSAEQEGANAAVAAPSSVDGAVSNAVAGGGMPSDVQSAPPLNQPQPEAEQDSAEATAADTVPNEVEPLIETNDDTWILVVVAVLVIAGLVSGFLALRTDAPERPKGRI